METGQGARAGLETGAPSALRLCDGFWPASLLLLALALLLAGAGGVRGAEAAPEYAVKAGYLFNFTKYTEWPAGVFSNAVAPLCLGVLGDDPFGPLFDLVVTNKTSQDRPVQIRRARDVNALRDCQVVFISRSERSRLPGILAVLSETRALTVCDTDALFQQGVMIKMTLVKGAVEFEVRLEPAEQLGLKFGSGMLGSARRVWTKNGVKEKRS